MPKKIITPKGAAFGQWTAIRDGGTCVRCRCSCGTEREVAAATLRNGTSTKCEKCRRNNFAGNRTHGESRSPEHIIWKGIKNRCGKIRGYFHVQMCDEWQGPQGFVTFLKYMGRKPSPDHQIDRINGLGNYEPGNVRWATRIEQMRNRSNNIIVTIDGQSKCVAQWVEVSGIPSSIIRDRLQRGWESKRAVFEKVHAMKIKAR